MQPNIQTMQTSIHYVTDTEGRRVFVQIPVAQWEYLQAILADERPTEASAETPEVIEREGILVVRATPLRDLGNITHEERNRRVVTLLQRVGL